MTVRIRTGYSFRSAVGRVEDVIEHIVGMGLGFAPITDTASTYGYVKWAKLCHREGLKPIFGVELAVTNSLNEKKPVVDFWTFIAQDSLLPIHELIGQATQQFQYQPRLTRAQALARDDVFTIMGHRAAVAEIIPRWGLYAGLGPSMARGQVRRALEAGHRLIPVCDNRYIKPGQQGLYETVCGRGASVQSYPQWIMTPEEWTADTSMRFGNEIWDHNPQNQLLEVVHRSNAQLVPAEMVKPVKAMSLEAMCVAGASVLGCDLTRSEYSVRLKRELELIEEKQFEDYFYLVADICQWARERMIVGPARGSSCGSLVCYLLKITSIDPLPHGLIFERFIDVNRADLPDIDIDFPEHRRAEVFEYIAQKYGRDKVARLGTVAMYQPRSALKEAAGALDIPPWVLNPVMDAIIKRSGGDSRALQTTEDTMKETLAGQELLAKYPEIMVATKMEGHPRHAGQHAAGIVITQNATINYVAIDQRTGATMCDKKDAEELNLLKIDALGLTQLSIFEHALELIGLPRDHLFGVPLDDQKAFDVLNNKKYAGIFQFNGLALQSITDQVKIESLNDIVAITALARPGPLNTGGTNAWIKIKNGERREAYPHPVFEPHLKETLGVIAYQEQVMRIGREIGGLSWEDVTALRKAMSRSLGKEFFDQYGDKWKAGARKLGIEEPVLIKVWDDLCAYGSWAFNLSHALAYGVVSYWCCWLKGHYPLEFSAATLSYTTDPDAQIKLLRELASEGIEYLSADIDLSTDKWTVKKGGNWNHLVGPLSNVVGCGPKMQAAIMNARLRREPLPERAQKLLTNPKTQIDSLYPVSQTIKRLMPDPKQLNIISTPMNIIDVQTNGQDYEVLVLCKIEQIKPKDENEALSVAKRGGKVLKGPTASLNLRLADDTDVIFARVHRWDFEHVGRPIIERGRAGKALYAVKGSVPKDFRMISVKAVRYIGDLGDGS